MEDTAKEIIEQTIVEKEKGRAPQPRNGFLIIIICLVVSVLSGALSGWWFSSSSREGVLTIDVKKIVDEKRKELQEKYKKEPTEATAKAMETELGSFLGRLEEGINMAGSDGQLVLLADIVLAGKNKDMTKEVSEYAKGD